MPNSSSAFQFGNRLVDSLQSWLEAYLAAGPLTMDKVKETFYITSITINPMAIRLKPNGKARIIVDMSTPHLHNKAHQLFASVESLIHKGQL